MPPRNRRTLLVRTSGLPAETPSDAIFKLMVEKFGAHELDAVQFCPGGLVRVTFFRETKELKQNLRKLALSFWVVLDVKLHVLFPLLPWSLVSRLRDPLTLLSAFFRSSVK